MGLFNMFRRQPFSPPTHATIPPREYFQREAIRTIFSTTYTIYALPNYNPGGGWQELHRTNDRAEAFTKAAQLCKSLKQPTRVIKAEPNSGEVTIIEEFRPR